MNSFEGRKDGIVRGILILRKFHKEIQIGHYENRTITILFRAKLIEIRKVLINFKPIHYEKFAKLTKKGRLFLEYLLALEQKERLAKNIYLEELIIDKEGTVVLINPLVPAIKLIKRIEYKTVKKGGTK